MWFGWFCLLLSIGFEYLKKSNENGPNESGLNGEREAKESMSRTAEIKLTVDLDSEDMPTRIEWQASEGQGDGPISCESMMLSVWDSENKTTAAIDLWIKDTSVEDLNIYFYQVIHKMADTYLRATKNEEIAGSIHEFGEGFGEKLGLLKRSAE